MTLSLPFLPPRYPRLRVLLPMVGARVCAGFPSPADDHLEGEFDLNELLVRNPPATFLVRARGESMSGEGAQILDGDLLVVDKSVAAHDGCIVIASLDGQFTVKRFRRRGLRMWLQPENKSFPEIEVGPEQDFLVWGVVIAKISQFR